MHHFLNNKLVGFFFNQVALPADEDYLPLKPRVGKAAKVCTLVNTVCTVFWVSLFPKNLKGQLFQMRCLYFYCVYYQEEATWSQI